MSRIRPLSPAEAKRTLANRFAGSAAKPGIADKLRQLNTKFGLRSLRAFIVWTRWQGASQGQGNEEVIAEIEILPTPKVVGLDGVTLNPFRAGMFPVGSLRLDEISGTFDRDTLKGRKVPGHPEIDPTTERFEFFYELVDDGRAGDAPAHRARYRLFGEPQRREGFVCWAIMLQRMNDDRQRDGTPSTLFIDRD